MEKKFLKTIGFAAIALGCMAMLVDNVFAQTPDKISINLNNCVKSFQKCRTESVAAAIRVKLRN